MLNTFSLKNNDFHEDQEISLYNSVLAYPDKENIIAYIADNENSEIVIDKDFKVPSLSDFRLKDWESGLLSQGIWNYKNLYPRDFQKHWLKMVRGSFRSGIMNPVTSFIVLETKEQEQGLLKKQEQILKSKNYFDHGSTERMSEPEEWIFLLLLPVIILL